MLAQRAGRTDDIKPEAAGLLQIAPDMLLLLSRLWIACVDVDESGAAHTKAALFRLETVLANPAEALTAWSLLVQEAGTICARRLAWTRPQLVQFLADHKITVKPAASEEHRRLDDCADLLRRYYVPAAKSQLDSLESALTPQARTNPDVQIRLLTLRSKCALLEDNYEVAADFARRALDRKADSLPALRLATLAYMLKGDLSAAARFVDRALLAGPADPTVWSHHLQLVAAGGTASPRPPATVAQSSEYRAAEAQVAFNAGDYSRVLDVTAGLPSVPT
jgi:tetratricopeptide (TPR) repeat protein